VSDETNKTIEKIKEEKNNKKEGCNKISKIVYKNTLSCKLKEVFSH